MDAVITFINNTITIVEVTHIHQPSQSTTTPPYAFSYRVTDPDYRLPTTHHYRTTSLLRYYLSQKCLCTTWGKCKIGALYTPSECKKEPITIGNVLLIHAKHSKRGYYGVSHLPSSWSRPIVTFFWYNSNKLKARYMLQSKESMEKLKRELFIQCDENTTITTLLHMLVVLVTKDFSSVIDMLVFPRLRKTSWKTFEDMQQLPGVRRMGVYVPSTLEFVVETCFFAQSPTLLEGFATQLTDAISRNPTNFKSITHTWLKKKDKHVSYMKRVLKYMAANT